MVGSEVRFVHQLNIAAARAAPYAWGRRRAGMFRIRQIACSRRSEDRPAAAPFRSAGTGAAHPAPARPGCSQAAARAAGHSRVDGSGSARGTIRSTARRYTFSVSRAARFHENCCGARHAHAAKLGAAILVIPQRHNLIGPLLGLQRRHIDRRIAADLGQAGCRCGQARPRRRPSPPAAADQSLHTAMG